MDFKEQIKAYIPYNEQEEADKKIMLNCIETFDDVLTRDNQLFHFTASNWIVNQERTKILMVYHNIYQSWAWTGGHADGENDLESVAKREAEEETGLKNLKLLSNGIYGIQILGVDSHHKRGKYVPTHMHFDCCYLFEADEKDMVRMKEDENSGVKWVNIEDVLDTTNEKMMKPVYQKLNEKLKDYQEKSK